MLLTVILPWPPSGATANHQWRIANGRIIQTAEAKAWKQTVFVSCHQAELAQGKLLDGACVPLSITLDEYPPNNRRHDVDGPIKLTLDGVADYLGCDDHWFHQVIARRHPVDRVTPRIEVTVEVATPSWVASSPSHVQNIVHASGWGQNRSTARVEGE